MEPVSTEEMRVGDDEDTFIDLVPVGLDPELEPIDSISTHPLWLVDWQQ